MQIQSIDHLVLTVHNIETTVHFYTHILGMTLVEFGQGRKALSFGDQKINLHQAGHEYSPHAHKPTPGSADLCFLTMTPLEAVVTHLNSHNIPIFEGPIQRTGATSRILSLYILDPDQNLIELSNPIQ